MGTSSAACEAFYCADVAVAVDRQQLTIIQQDISLVASVAIEFSNRVALLDQDIRNFLAEVGLARYQAGKVLAALRAVGEYQRGTCYDCRIAQDSHRIAGAGPRSKFLAKLAPPLCRRTSAEPGSPKGFAAARIR